MTTAITNPLTKTNTPHQILPLREAVQQALDNYFSQLGNESIRNLYDLVLAEVEAPLLETMMKYTNGNQSKAAIFLGISRGTLRKKLKLYDIHGKD